MALLSFVIPCYRSEDTIEKVINEVIEKVSERECYDYEIICVNDFSPDNVQQVLESLASKNQRIKVANLSKNMGKHSALMAGYSVARGEYIISLDDDFQSPTGELWRLLDSLIVDGNDFATARYRVKKQSLFKNMGSNVNHYMQKVMLNKPLSLRFENFFAMRRYVMLELLKYTRPYPYIEGLILRITRNIGQVTMEERDRFDDKPTGFTFNKSVSLWVNGLTAFSIKPLRIASLMGFLMAIAGFLFGLYLVIQRLVNPEIAIGFTSMVAINLLGFGIVMICLGIIGEYIGRIYICINDSPQFVIKSSINLD